MAGALRSILRRQYRSGGGSSPTRNTDAAWWFVFVCMTAGPALSSASPSGGPSQGVSFGDAAVEHEVSGDDGLTRYLQGNLLQLDGDHAGAIRLFRAALGSDSTQGAVYLGLARSYTELGLPDSAVAAARAAARWLPDEPEPLRLAAVSLSRMGQVDEAADAWRLALERDPEDFATRMNLLALLDHLRRREEALQVIEGAPVAQKSVPSFRVRLGRLLLASGRAPEAIEELAGVLEGNPDYPEAEALMLAGLGRFDAADGPIPAVDRLLAGQPALDRVRLSYSRLLLATDAWREAEPHLAHLEASRPGEPALSRLRGIHAYRDRDFDRAEERFRAAAEQSPQDPDPLRWLCRIAMLRGDPGEALIQAGRVQARSPGDLEGLLCQAFALSALERDAEALVAVEEILRVDPAHREGGLLGSLLLAQTGRRADAIRELERLRTHHPGDREIRFRLGAILEEDDQVERAIGVLDSLLLEDPDDHQVLNHVGYLCIDRGLRLAESVRRVQRALELDPGNPAYLDSYGWGLFRKGDAAGAVAPLEEAARKSPREGEIFRHLAEVRLALGQRAAARDALLKARELSPDDDRVRLLLEQLGP